MVDVELGKMSVLELENVLLSDDYLSRLYQSIDVATRTSFGLERSRDLGFDYRLLGKKISGIEPEIMDKIDSNCTKYGTRTLAHLRRLLDPERSIQENYFGLLFALHGVKDGQSVYPSVAGDQFNNTGFFWSFAPYLAEQLSQYGVSPSDIVGSIFKWGETGRGYFKPIAGTEKFYENVAFRNCGLVLSIDPSDQTHEFSQGVARLMCSNVEIFRDIIGRTNPNKVQDLSISLRLTG